jgi:hypothetical protein
MKIEIHIDEVEITDILESLKEQGRDVTVDEVKTTMEDYIYGAIEDSKHERVEAVMDILMDEQ